MALSTGPVLVTGAAGFAGSHLLDLLSAQGLRPTGWYRPATDRPREIAGVRWQAVDLLEREAVIRAVTEWRPTVVYHCAGAAHVGRSWAHSRETLAANVLGTHHLLNALRTVAIRARVLIPGSSMVYRPSDRAIREDDPIGPGSPYALSKLAQEMLGRRAIEEDGQEVLLTRSFNHMGPRQDPSFAASGFARQIALIEAGLAQPVIPVGNLEAARDLTDVRDTVRAYQSIVERGRPGVIYNVCSGMAYKIGEIFERLARLGRVAVEIRIDPSKYRPSDMPLSLGSPERISREVGWIPQIPLDQSLADILEYWRREVREAAPP